MGEGPYIYFLRPVGALGPIKIGCSDIPMERLRTFARWSPAPLEIAAIVPGSLSIESWLHNRFRDAHSHLEWYRPTPELVALVREAAETDAIPGCPQIVGEPINASDRRPLAGLPAVLAKAGLDIGDLAKSAGVQAITIQKVWCGMRGAARAVVALECLGVPCDPSTLLTPITSGEDGGEGNG